MTKQADINYYTGRITEEAAIKIMGELSRYVYRLDIEIDDAAKLAWDIAQAFGREAAKRLADNGGVC